jgi:hypothetical protein
MTAFPLLSIEPVEAPPRVSMTEVRGGLFRVWLFGKVYRDFATLSNAARCASALMTLDSLDALP